MADWLRAKFNCLVHEHILTWRGLALGAMALLFWFRVFPVLAPAIIPAAWYLDVRSVSVADAVAGGPSPAVTVDRDINANFTGGVVAHLRRIDEEGILWSYCEPGVREDIGYQSGKPYPGRDLNWWMASPPGEPCDLIEGRYQFRIVWTFPVVLGLATKEVVVESPIFTVRNSFPQVPPEYQAQP